MNPLMIAAAGKAVESGKAKELLTEVQKPTKYAIAAVLIVIALVIIWYVTRKLYKQYQAAQFNNVDTTKDPKGALARTYANRIDSAFTWYNDDEEAIYQVGREMRANGVSFALVASAYKAGFQTDLAQKLSSRLNSTELRKFYDAAGLTSLK
jgi:cation transport regulator ChaB